MPLMNKENYESFVIYRLAFLIRELIEEASWVCFDTGKRYSPNMVFLSKDFYPLIGEKGKDRLSEILRLPIYFHEGMKVIVKRESPDGIKAEAMNSEIE